ncbi:hypothetical protein D3C87_1843400 [compost metagenome]
MTIDIQDMVVTGQGNAGQTCNLQGGDQLSRIAFHFNIRSKSDMVEIFFIRRQILHGGQLQHVAV